jgi:hypothetical protein
MAKSPFLVQTQTAQIQQTQQQTAAAAEEVECVPPIDYPRDQAGQ